MHPIAIVAVLLGLLAVSTAIGLVWRARTGRIRGRAGDAAIDLGELVPGAIGGRTATILQFSTEFCAPCRSTHTLFEQLAAEHRGVVHLDVDVTERADISRRFSLLQSPTTLVLDASGVAVARIGGAPRRTDVSDLLRSLTPSNTGAQQ